MKNHLQTGNGKQQPHHPRGAGQQQHTPPEQADVRLPPHHEARRHDDAEVMQKHLQRDHQLLRRAEQAAAHWGSRYPRK